ncbi:MAG: hypothetical protein IJS80_05520 [Lachnospiraceae bacterium]|nr:hypothetical protein [Lachnospiraceae bacterium]
MSKENKISFTAFHIKIMALVLFIAGRSLIQLGYTHAVGDSFTEGPWAGFYITGYILTFTAMPMICFLTAEAAMKTRNLRQYFTRLTVAAVFTELLLDAVSFGSVLFDNGFKAFIKAAFSAHFNLYFAMILGSVTVVICERCIKRKFSAGSIPYVVLTVLTIWGFSMAAHFARFEQGTLTVLLISGFYFFSDNRLFKLVSVVIIHILAWGRTNSIFLFAPVLGCVPVMMYNGREGRKSGLIRLITYTAYPVCYAVVLVIIKLMG